MAISYGSITIVDITDIERIYTVYAKSTTNTTAPSAAENLWSESISTAPGSGDYIWQRTVVEKSGTGELTYGNPVCVTGPEGDVGATGKGVKSLVTQYYLSTSSSSVTGGSWGTAPQSYPTTGTKYYWTKTITTYTDNTTYESTAVYDVALTSSVKDARDANVTANEAKDIAQQTSTDVTNLQTRTKYFWTNLTAHTNGTSGWTKPDYPAGTFAASGISGTTFDYENSNTYGYNTLYSNGIKLRYNAINLGELTGSSLIFYNPSTTSQGGKAMELSGSALKFYNPSNSSISMMDLTNSGLTFKTSAGTEIGKFGSDSSGGLLELSGRLNIKGGGRIGQDSDNYWEFGDNKSYNDEDSAYLIGKGTASIQSGETGHWRIDSNRIHTGWYQLNDSSSSVPAGSLHFDTGADNGSTYYWDYGMHYPNKAGSGNNKFLYIRRSNATTSTTLGTMKGRIDDDTYWTYKFYIDGNGDVHAQNFYAGETLIGGNDSAAGKLTTGAGSPTQPVYFRSDEGHVGEVATTTYQLNAAGAKGVDTSTPNTFSNDNVPTTLFMKNFVEGKGYLTVDEKVRVNTRSGTDSTTKGYLTFITTAPNTVGTLVAQTDSGNNKYGVYVTGTNGDTTLYAPKMSATTFNGYTLAAAAAKGVDTSMTSTSTSTNLPTTKAVADLIATYLPLAGGTVSGAVDINDELYADSATFGNLIVNGVGRFTNGIYGDLIGSVTGNITGNASTADKVNHNLIIKLASGTTEGTNMFTFNGSVAKTVDITKSALGLGNVENKSSATIRGELTSANVTTALGFTPYNSTNPNGYTTNVGTITGVTAGTGLSGGGTSGTVTLNHSNSVTAQTTQGIYPIKIDAQGHISAYGSAPTTLSGYGITDAKIANGVITLGSNTITPLTSQWTANLYVGKTATDKANAAATNGNVYLNLVENNTVRNAHNLVGANGLTITTADTSGTITFTSPSAFTDVQAVNIGTETNPQYVLRFTKSGGGTVDVSTANIAVVQSEGANRLVSTNEPNGLTVAGPVKFSNGVPVTMKPNSSAGQFLKDDGTWATPTNTNTTYTLTNALSSHKFTWTLTAGGSGSGSTTTALELVQGNNITLTDDTANKKVTIAATDTKYSAGNGLRLNGTQFINTRIPFVAGTQTAQTGSWTGVCNDITALYDGLTIAYWLPRAGSGNATLNLTINGNDTGAKNCYYSGTTRLTTHFGAGNIIYLTYQSAADINGTTYEGWWANANYDSNDTGYYHRRIYPNMKAGSNKIYPYTLIMQLPDGRWESLVTSNSTGTSKARNTHGFLLGHILLMYYNETYTENQNLSTYRIWSAHTGLIDHRYSFNTANDATNGTIGYKPIYLVGSLGSDGLFYLAEKWWTQTLPTTADGKIYIYIGDAYDYYRMTFTEDKPMYIYTNGKLREFSQDAATVAGYTVAKDVPSNAVFSDTWKALSTSQAGYVAQAPNDTGKFLRGDATWAAVTKTNVGLGNVDNTADANKRVKGANITTTTNAVAKYSDTNGTFADSTTTFDGNNLVIGSTDNPGNLKIGAKNDNYGLMPNTSNYNQIGSSSLYWYRSYVTHYYGSQSHINNWDAGKNIGTQVTSSAASTLGSVYFYNTCAAGGTQTKTLLTADSTANSNVTITLPKTTGTLALTSEIPTNYVTLNTVQNITANKIFSAGIKWTAESGTNPSKFGACSYNSTLEALVFSFS